MRLFGKGKGGWNCDQVNPDGTRTCRRVKIENGERLASGSEITIGVNPETCDPVFTGDAQFIMDDEDNEIDSIARRMTSQCKRNKGL